MSKPICNLSQSEKTTRKPLYEKRLGLTPEYQIFESNNSGLVFMHPQPTDQVLTDLYSVYNEDYDFVNVTKDRIENEYADRLKTAKSFGIKEGKVLDIGAGAGGFLYVFKEAGYDVTGTEYSQEIIDLGEKHFGVTSQKLDLSDLKSEEKFKVIHSHHVLEHVRDPLTYFKEVHSLLADDGVFMFEVPNEFWSVILSIRRFLGRPKKYPVYPSLHHLFFYRKKVLKKYLKQSGFELIKYKGYHKRHMYHPNKILRFVQTIALTLFGNMGYGTIHFIECKKAR